VASSADGTKLVATAIGESTYSSTGGYIYTSTDSGATWTQQAHGTSREVWRAVASSADGTKLVAVVDGGYIYTSTDSGATWSQRATSQRWRAVASSADGTNLVATVGTTSSSATLGYVYTSADSGVTWTQRLAAGAHYWQAVSSSADGSKIVATSTYGYVYTSTDSGANWTERKPSSISSDYWGAVVSSSDGMRIVAAHHINGSTSNDNFQTSIDEGSTWTTATPYQLYDDISCRALATSASAMKLVAATSTYYCLNSSNCNYSFYVSTSSDGGTSWDSLLSSPQIDDIASSADGTHLVAIGPAGIFTSSGPTP
jgi:photosystem II stability/assembly factor-like uncharacterized protein